jgi:haloalkane dehalogenase
LILPTTPEMPGAAEGRAVAEALKADERPGLVLWADSDPVLPLSVGERVSGALGYPPPRVIADAGHFLQEDAGPEIGAIIAEWLTG